MPIRAVLFDLGDTLTRDLCFDVAAGLARIHDHLELGNLFPPNELVAAGLALRDELFPRRDASDLEITCPQFLHCLLESLGATGEWDGAELERIFFSAAVASHPEPGARETLAALRAKGLALGVLSNTFFSHDLLAEQLLELGLYPFLDAFVCSSTYGVRKPHPLLFQIALRRLGTAPGETLFVGNHPRDDVAGANLTGLVSVWYNSTGQSRPEGIEPRYEIRRLLDVVAIATGGGEANV